MIKKMEIGFVIGGIVIFGAAVIVSLNWKKVKARKEVRIFASVGINWTANVEKLVLKIMKWKKEKKKAKILEP